LKWLSLSVPSRSKEFMGGYFIVKERRGPGPGLVGGEGDEKRRKGGVKNRKKAVSVPAGTLIPTDRRKTGETRGQEAQRARENRGGVNGKNTVRFRGGTDRGA